MKQLAGINPRVRLGAALALAAALLAAACGGQTKEVEGDAPEDAELKVGVKPEPDPEVAVIEMENAAAYGEIVIELYPNIAPQMVERFKTLAREGFYNGTSFHRVIAPTAESPGGVVQGGDPNTKDDDPDNDGTGSSGHPDVPAELSDIPYEAGTVGAARGDIDSANCQFFISLGRNAMWDRQYTVFGKVIKGLSYAMVISGAPGRPASPDGINPYPKIVIKSVAIRPRSGYAAR